jgi:hypothetical protein
MECGSGSAILIKTITSACVKINMINEASFFPLGPLLERGPARFKPTVIASMESPVPADITTKSIKRHPDKNRAS